VGRSLADAFVKPAPPSSRRVFAIEQAMIGAVGPVSFNVAAGETLGLVGLRGAGHHTVGRAIFGHLPLGAGHIILDARRADPPVPAAASPPPTPLTPCPPVSASSPAGGRRRASPPTWRCARTSI